MRRLAALAAATLVGAVPVPPNATKPHLIFVLTDDMGFGSWPSPRIHTPALDALAGEGITLTAHTYKFCSPSRASFLTGRWPWRISSTRCDATACNYLPAYVQDGVHLGFTMLPARLAAAGYYSVHVGKWHQGLYAPQFTPVARGFNVSDGFLSGGEDHFTQAGDLNVGNCGIAGAPQIRDAYIGNATAPSVLGQYTGTRFAAAAVQAVRDQAASRPGQPLMLYLAQHNTHGPLEALPEFEALYANVSWATERKYYAMMSTVDAAIANLTAALKASGMWDDTVLVWAADNGAPVQVGGTNGGLRGGKGSNWEGGTKTPMIVAGGRVPPALRGTAKPDVGAAHLMDLFATFLSLAGLDPAAEPNPAAPAPVDSVDLWPWLTGQAPVSPRATAGMVLDHLTNLNETAGIMGAMIRGGLKLVRGGSSGELQSTWYGGPGNGYFSPNASQPAPSLNFTACFSGPQAPPGSLGGCVFNLTADPLETVDLAPTHPALLASLLAEFHSFDRSYHPPPAQPPANMSGLCAVAATQDYIVAPWLPEPLPEHMG